MADNIKIIMPDWPAPIRVRAATTLRQGGVSRVPYASLNLGDHVGDDKPAVAENRRRLAEFLNLPTEPQWLNQVHGTTVVDAAIISLAKPEADSSISRKTGIVCAVLTADCLPVLFCDLAGQVVAAAHAGWRGLADGVIEATATAMNTAPNQIMAWLGPAIGPALFEVGEEVRQAFIESNQKSVAAFRPSPNQRWLADLYQLARIRLQALGIEQIYGGQYCTYSEVARFYSYRRDGVTGRMASLIWLDNRPAFYQGGWQ